MAENQETKQLNRPDVIWTWRHFELFTAREWHAILKLRAEVFVVEQQCPYSDPDHKDPLCWHLVGLVDGDVVATLRAVPPGVSYTDSALGRVVIDPRVRGLALGRELMERGMAFNRAMWGGAIRISAQAHLEAFYHSLGFATQGKPYLEDDIPHIEMRLAAVTAE